MWSGAEGAVETDELSGRHADGGWWRETGRKPDVALQQSNSRGERGVPWLNTGCDSERS